VLSQVILKKLTGDFRTSESNVLREYLQHLLLSYLYQHDKSSELAFKGGTAFRILFGSPRFSEDLDFSCNLGSYPIKILLNETLPCLEREGIAWSAVESKTTSGGYFARYHLNLHGQTIPIEFNISLRDKIIAEPILVASPFIPAYQCMTLPLERLVWEKIDALLRRKKPRDFFDLYFLLRERRGIEEIVRHKKKLLSLTELLDVRHLKEELRLFLPTTQHALLNHFQNILLSELRRL
jgi:predicted nucleotidyltransferase component of viral defense system